MTPFLERTFTVPFTHRVYFTRSTFSPGNDLLANILSRKDAKALAVVDEGVARAFPSLAGDIVAYFSGKSSPANLVFPPLLVPGGEATKNSRDLVDQLHRLIDHYGVCRHSYMLTIGGGALLDAAGFAAATAHRGIRHIRFPTTTLSQADGGIGVKNGINAFGKKNFIGTFSPPFAVINDSDFWSTLPPAEKRSGLIEAVKVALIRDVLFFDEIEHLADALAQSEAGAMDRVIFRCAELHFQHITESGDPFEVGSARPLDFGHWSAHKLEQISGFALSHGAAVALGVALDSLYSHKVGLLPRESLERILRLITRLGFNISDPLLQTTDANGNWTVLQGLEEFREHLGGELTITLLQKIGHGIEVHDMNSKLIRESILELAQRCRPQLAAL